MVIRCKVNELELLFNTLEEMNKYEKFNEITYIDCSFDKIKELNNLPNSLQKLWCDEEIIIGNVNETLQITREINMKIYDEFMKDKISENEIIRKLKCKIIIGEKSECLICHEKKNCIHLPCKNEHNYCLKCYVNWYYINKHEKKCCYCLEPFNDENCLFI